MSLGFLRMNYLGSSYYPIEQPNNRNPSYNWASSLTSYGEALGPAYFHLVPNTIVAPTHGSDPYIYTCVCVCVCMRVCVCVCVWLQSPLDT